MPSGNIWRDTPALFCPPQSGKKRGWSLEVPEFEQGEEQSPQVVKQTVARLLINYYWAGVALSFWLFLQTSGKSELILLSFYPLFLAVGSLIRFFVQRGIVRAFHELNQTGCLSKQALQTLWCRFEGRLNSKWANTFGIVGGLCIIWFCRHSLTSSGLSFIEFTIISIDVLLAYAIGVAAWKAAATGSEIRRLGLSGDLRIRPFYPGGCAGLGAIGRLLFSASLS
jgi:hypothetical protein